MPVSRRIYSIINLFYCFIFCDRSGCWCICVYYLMLTFITMKMGFVIHPNPVCGNKWKHIHIIRNFYVPRWLGYTVLLHVLTYHELSSVPRLISALNLEAWFCDFIDVYLRTYIILYGYMGISLSIRSMDHYHRNWN